MNGWVVAGIAWLLVSPVVGVVVGKMIKHGHGPNWFDDEERR